MKKTILDSRSIQIRKEVLDVIKYAKRGHISSAFSNVEILRVLFERILRAHPKDPHWVNRDRFILSKGHSCLSLYVFLSMKGYFPKNELKKFCAFDGILGGHPQYAKVPGIEASTGSLGHGFPIAVGMATTAKIDKKKYIVYLLLSDGECDEGTTWEAALHANKHKLNNLIILLDYNKLQSYSTTTEVLDLEPMNKKWQSFGFDVQEVDGHNLNEIERAIVKTRKILDKPHVIICHTIKGKGIKEMENNPAWHHKSKITDEEIERLRESFV